MPRATPTPEPKAERQKKTPEQRAAEALTTAQNVYGRVVKKLAEARAAVAELEAEETKAAARLQYVGQHPDLPEADRERIAAMFAEEEEPTPEPGD